MKNLALFPSPIHLLLRSLLFTSLFAACPVCPVKAEEQKPHITLFMAGDSTMASQALVPPTPARGWGQMLQPYFNDNVRVENHAASGSSTKSFIDSKRWQTIIDHIQPGDFVIIQFGHNDPKTDEGRH